MKEERAIEYNEKKGVPIIDLDKTKSVKTGLWRTFKPILDDSKCIRCKRCFTFCPEGAVSWKNDRPEIDYDVCKGCLICVNECPVKALTFEKEK